MITSVAMTAAGAADRTPAPAGPVYGPGILLRGPYTRRVIRQQWYLASGFLIGLAQVIVLTTVLITGAVWLLVLLGVPILLFGFAVLRRYAERERRRIHRLTGVRIESPYREAPAEQSWLTRLHHRVSDPASWRDLAHLIASTTLGLGWFVAVVFSWGLVLGALVVPYYHTPLWNWLSTVGGSNSLSFLASTPAVVAGCAGTLLFVWLITPALMELATRIQVGLGQVLLGPGRVEMERRERSLRTTRGQAVAAAEAERRRIERDLHDGAQQRLVALAMDLGMAKAKLNRGDDTEAAAKLVAEAHEGVKLALIELRDLARGIHPAVLTDRGLEAALAALTARSPIPVELESELRFRPSPEIESAAYFVASECLANMAKHADATRAWIDLEHVNGHLRLVVGDNGVGGATVNPRGGLHGLSDRIAPLDGILSVSSPIGGPTLIVMEIPCEAPRA